MSHEFINWARKQRIVGVAQSVLVSLSLFANEEGECWPSYQTIANETGLSVRTVQRAIFKLVKENYITLESRKINHSNLYKFPKSYPQENRTQCRVYKNKPDKRNNKPDTVSCQTGHSDVRILKNCYIELGFNKNDKVQEMYKSDPKTLTSFLKQVLAKKDEVENE